MIEEGQALGLFSDFEIVIYWAWRIGFVSFFIAALLFTAVLTIHQYFKWKTKRAIEFREIWEPILLQSLDEVPNQLPPIAEKDMLTFLILWNYFQELLLEESKGNLLVLARRIDLPRITRKILRKRNIKSRLLAINTIGWLKDKDSWNLMKKLINHRDTIFSLSVARALIRINPRKSTWLILPLIMERNDWSIDRCAELIRQIGMEEIADKLILQINRTPPNLLPKMIRFLDLLLPSQSNSVVKELLAKHKDKEIIFACLNVFKDIDDLQIVRNFLTHESWEIRMQAAVCLGKFGSEKDIKYLSAATGDPEWWVRYRSAQALARIPTMTIRKLKNIGKRQSNQFSQDVILRIVTEKEVAESCGLSY